VGDEVLAIDSVRLTDDLPKAIAGRKVGEVLNLIINRGGQVRELQIKLIENPLLAYRLEAIPNASDKQKALYNKWLYVK
jgi:predicted metalloprotease with PDZ domain